MDQLRINGKKWLIALAAIILPGLGHYIGRNYNRAALLSASYILHMIIAYRTVKDTMYIESLSIAYIVLLLPCYYYFSVYDALQNSTNPIKVAQPITKSSWFIVMTIAFVALLLLSPNVLLHKGSLIFINAYPSLNLLLTGVYFWSHPYNKTFNYHYLGKITAGALLMLMAGLLWLQADFSIHWLNWIYMLPIIVLFEVVIIVIRRLWLEQKEKYRLDIKSLIFCIVVIGVSGTVLAYSNYPTRWLQSFYGGTGEFMVFDDDSGYSFVQAPIKIALQDEIPSINVEHLNGYLRLIYADIEEIEIESTLFVQSTDLELAEQVNQMSQVEVDLTNNINIHTKLYRYALDRVPRMNMTIRIPRDAIINGKLQIKLNHGALHIKGIQADAGAYIETDTASINLYSLKADVFANSKRGSVYMLDIHGSIKAQIKKGNMTIIHPQDDVDATTLNGLMYVKGNQVNGPWLVEATVGDAQIKLPKTGNYRLSAKVTFGNIHLQQMLVDNLKSYSYSVGTGHYEIKVYASNQIEIN